MPRVMRAFLLVGGVTAAGLFTGAQLTRTAMATGADRYRDLDTLAQALHHIEAQYLGTTTTRQLVYGAIDGMMDELDPHSVFLDPDDMAAAQVRTEGVYSGIGVELKQIQGKITVVRTVPTSSADGTLVRGDVLENVNGESLDDLNQASKLLQGPEGSTVVLGISRKGALLTHTLTRTKLRDRTVRVSKLNKDWAFAEVSRFQRNTASDLAQGLKITAPKEGVIIDLRGNAGGLLDEAVQVVDLFASEGTIVETKGPNDVELESHKAKKFSPYSHLSTIILTDGDSASASEIVAGAMRSLSGSRLVGTNTYGKWSVQRMYVFEDQSAIKLTVARYHIEDAGSGTDLVGLKPDHIVERNTAQIKAIVRLRELTQEIPEAHTLLDVLSEKEGGTVAQPHLGPLSERLTLDPQLAAAWTLALDNH